jgi:hypothetical protein
MKFVLLILMLSSALLGADVTGKWSGTFTRTGPDGETKTAPAFLVLKQDGSKLTGSGGPSESEQKPISNGKVDGNRLIFDVVGDNSTISFDVVVEGDQIKGAMKRGEGESAKLDVKRVVN